MTAAFQDVEFGSRFPEYREDHPRRKRAAELWPEITKHRKELRKTGSVDDDIEFAVVVEIHLTKTPRRVVGVEFAELGPDRLR